MAKESKLTVAPKSVATKTALSSPAARPKARRDKVAIAGFFDEKVRVQLKQIGLRQGEASVQDLLSEALNLLFEKHKLPPIA